MKTDPAPQADALIQAIMTWAISDMSFFPDEHDIRSLKSRLADAGISPQPPKVDDEALGRLEEAATRLAKANGGIMMLGGGPLKVLNANHLLNFIAELRALRLSAGVGEKPADYVEVLQAASECAPVVSPPSPPDAPPPVAEDVVEAMFAAARRVVVWFWETRPYQPWGVERHPLDNYPEQHIKARKAALAELDEALTAYAKATGQGGGGG